MKLEDELKGLEKEGKLRGTRIFVHGFNTFGCEAGDHFECPDEKGTIISDKIENQVVKYVVDVPVDKNDDGVRSIGVGIAGVVLKL